MKSHEIRSFYNKFGSVASRADQNQTHGVTSRACLAIFAAFLTSVSVADAEVVIYATDFDSMNPFFSVTGQEYWESNDPDICLGFGSTDGIGTIRKAGAGSSSTGYLGGYLRGSYPPGQTDVLLGPAVVIPSNSESIDFSVETVIIGSPAAGEFSADDSFGWSIRDQADNELYRLALEPTSSVSANREIVSYDSVGTRLSSDLDLVTGSLYIFRIKITAEAGGDRVLATVDDSSLVRIVGDVLLPTGSIQDITKIAANWKMSSAVVDPATGVASGFGSNFMMFENYRITSVIPDSVYAANVTAREGDGIANFTAMIDSPLLQDLEIFYTTATVGAPAIAAVAGDDFTLIASNTLPLIIPAGMVSASIDLPLVDDSVAEGGELFSVQLLGTDDGAVSVASPEVLVTIIDDDDQDYDGLSDAFELAAGLDPGEEDDALLDTDADEISNLLEYALGLDPNSDELATPLMLTTAPGTMTASFVANQSYTNLRYQIETSPDLLKWDALSDTVVSTSGDLVTREASFSTSPARKFVRLSVKVDQ